MGPDPSHMARGVGMRIVSGGGILAMPLSSAARAALQSPANARPAAASRLEIMGGQAEGPRIVAFLLIAANEDLAADPDEKDLAERRQHAQPRAVEVEIFDLERLARRIGQGGEGRGRQFEEDEGVVHP